MPARWAEPDNRCLTLYRSVRDSHSDVFGNLFEAPYGVGDVAYASEDPFASLTVEVQRKRGSTYAVQVSCHRH
jgi:hypothetical protein